MQDVSIAFGGPPVLDHVSLYVERGERVCLLGRNGAGKSTLMKVLDGTIAPDSGTVVRETGASVARLEQDVPEDVAGSTFDVVAAGLGERGQLLAQYHDASHRVSVDATEVAYVTVFLASDKAWAISGHLLIADGGAGRAVYY